MNHQLLKSVIYDQHDVIRNAQIVERRYDMDPGANYVVCGLRRAGKSTLLYKRARDLVEQGVSWEQIVYVNFEDERLSEFALEDFNDILEVQAEMSHGRGYFFLDEVQNVAGWEKFARRLADAKERIYITGSNAHMLSREVASTLGGRYLTMEVETYRFDEYLRASHQSFDEGALHTTRERGRIRGLFDTYLHTGGFPEASQYRSPRTYVESVYQKALLGDIATRNKVRDPQSLRILMKKVAETVRSEVSYSTLHGMLRAIGLTASKDTVINYLSYARDAYLVFEVLNFAAKFSEQQGNPKWYFSDNGLLNLFLLDRDTALLENLVAIALRSRFGEELFYLKSAKTGIDLDFYVPEEGLAVQVAYSIAGEAREREVGTLKKLAALQPQMQHLLIVTMDEEETVELDGATIEVVPAWRFLLDLARSA